jgi:hypothetical protein
MPFPGFKPNFQKNPAQTKSIRDFTAQDKENTKTRIWLTDTAAPRPPYLSGFLEREGA